MDIAAAVAATQGSYPIPLQGGDMGFHKAAALPTELSSEITKLDVGAVSEPLVTLKVLTSLSLLIKSQRYDDYTAMAHSPYFS